LSLTERENQIDYGNADDEDDYAAAVRRRDGE
jgi:hypothetical protein